MTSLKPKPSPSLYGIIKSNRTGDELWGKNQFNSTFPTALCCYMRDKQIPALYLKLSEENNQLLVQSEPLGFNEVFNTTLANKELTFVFESKYEPYQQWAYGDIGNIDLVIKYENKFLRALEIKLTVLPDDATHQDDESDWGSELVVRAATTSYAALGIADSCHDILPELRQLFEPICQPIRNWGNPTEIKSRKNSILDCLDAFQSKYCSRQKPFLMQPIWKTKGKSPELCDDAFDVFVWSDFALCRAFIERAKQESVKNSNKKNEVPRYLRAASRLAHSLYDLSTRGKVDMGVYREDAMGNLTDKEFALGGKITRTYMSHPRKLKPAVPKEALREIILGSGQDKLSPERRFDGTIYFTAKHLFEDLENESD
jgi:HindVP restriction endonuclease